MTALLLPALLAGALGLSPAPPAPAGAVHVYRLSVDLDRKAPAEQVVVWDLRPKGDDPSTRFAVWRVVQGRWVKAQAVTAWKIGGKGLLGAWAKDYDGDGRVELVWLDDERKRNGQTVHVYRQRPGRVDFSFVQILGSTATGFADGAVSLVGDGTSTVWRVDRPGGRWVCSSGCP